MEVEVASEGVLTKNRCSTKSRDAQARRYNRRSMSASEDVGKQEVQWQVEVLASLSLLLAPHYVSLAFNLPPGCGTIWSSIEEDIVCHCATDCPPSGEEDLASYLLLFFAPQLVDIVQGNLTHLVDSFLGIDYTLRLGKASLASRILEDVMHEHVYTKEGPLAGFMGDSWDAGNDADNEANHGERGWQEVTKKKGQRPQESGSGSGSRSQGSAGRGGGSGRGGGGRRWRGGRGQKRAAHFTDLPLVVVPLPAYKTPPKAPREAWVLQRQGEASIGERSRLFWDHPLEKSAPYNPQVAALGRTYLFHGMRASSLDGVNGFRVKGIHPRYKPNEFCADEAFYLSNSVRHAYEHPLHHHPGRRIDTVDPIVVLVFDVDIEVLHGIKCPPGHDDVFALTWFKEPDHEWEEFCRGNMQQHLQREDDDIVIGPICKVKPAHHKYEALKIELEGGVELVQVAFCSARAWRWLETCCTLMYLERRLDP